MFSSLGPMSVRSSHIPTGHSKQYGAQIPKGFSVRIFKSPALSNFPYGGEPKFDIGYRPKTPANSWQKPTWTSAHEQNARDAPSRAPRVFANTLDPDLNAYGDGQAADYSIYPSTANDTYIYERSLDTYTETDAASEVTFSPSCFSTLSNDSTTTLLSTVNSDSPTEDPNAKRPPHLSFLAQHPFRVKLPSLSRTLSSSTGARGVNLTSSSLSCSPTPVPIIQPSSSLSADRDAAYARPQSPSNHTFPTQLNVSGTSETSYPQSTARSSSDKDRPTYSSQATRKSTNRTSFLFGRTSRSNAEQSMSEYSTRPDEERPRSRVSSMFASAGPSDGFSSNSPADVHSAAATRGSSPPHEPPQSHDLGRSTSRAAHPTLRITTNRDEFPQPQAPRRDTMTPNGVTQSTNNVYRHDYTYATQGRHPGYASPVYKDEPQTVSSTQFENSSASVPTDQPVQSSRTLGDRQRRAVVQANSASSACASRERVTRPLSQTVNSASQIDFSSAPFGPNSRAFRNSVIEVSQLRQDETEYTVNSSVYDRQERPVSRTQSPTEILPTTQRTLPPREVTVLGNNRDTYPSSANAGNCLPARRERSSQVVSSASGVYPDGFSLNSSHRPRQNSDERQSNVFPTQQLPSSVTGGYPQNGSTIHSHSPPRGLSRGNEPVSASQTRNVAEHNTEIHLSQRRDSDEQRRRPSPTSFEGQLQTDIDIARLSNVRSNQPEHQRIRVETRRPSDELDDIAFCSATPTGIRCVRWNPNLIAPSPIFASQRRKGWFNRRGDQLWTNDGAYKPPHLDQEYPLDLSDYPNYGEGWMNEAGVRIDMQHRLIPKPPLRSALKKS